jgi:hypothetical protein
MRRRIFGLVVGVLVGAGVGAFVYCCARTDEVPLREGMSEEEVKSLLGEPDYRGPERGARLTSWNRMKPNRDERGNYRYVLVEFKNRRVVSWETDPENHLLLHKIRAYLREGAVVEPCIDGTGARSRPD